MTINKENGLCSFEICLKWDIFPWHLLLCWIKAPNCHIYICNNSKCVCVCTTYAEKSFFMNFNLFGKHMHAEKETEKGKWKAKQCKYNVFVTVRGGFVCNVKSSFGMDRLGPILCLDFSGILLLWPRVRHNLSEIFNHCKCIQIDLFFSSLFSLSPNCPAHSLINATHLAFYICAC